MRKVPFDSLQSFILHRVDNAPIWDLSLLGVDRREVEQASSKFTLILFAERHNISLAPVFDALPDYVNDKRAFALPWTALKAALAESGRVDAAELAACGADKRNLLLLAEDCAVPLEPLLAVHGSATPRPEVGMTPPRVGMAPSSGAVDGEAESALPQSPYGTQASPYQLVATPKLGGALVSHRAGELQQQVGAATAGRRVLPCPLPQTSPSLA